MAYLKWLFSGFFVFLFVFIGFGQGEDVGQDSVVFSQADTTWAWSLYNQGDSLANIQYYKEALEATTQALKIYSQLPFSDEKVALCKDNIGVINYYLGNFDDALSSLESALEIYKRVYDKDHKKIAETIDNIGGILLSKGDFEKSLIFLKEALAIKLKSGNDCGFDISTSYSNIGLAYQRLGELTLAIEYQEKAVETRIKCVGEEDLGVATMLSNLGTFYYISGKLDKGIEQLEKSLALFEKLGNERNPDFANCLDNLGLCYRLKGEYDKGNDCLNKALIFREKYLGPNHPSLALSYGNMGHNYLNKGDYKNAILYSEKAIAIFEHAGLESHPEIATFYSNLASVFRDMGDIEKSIAYHKKVLNIRLNIFGGNHYSVAEAYQNLGANYSVIGETDKAIDYLNMALKTFLESQEETHPSVATIYSNLGVAYGDKGEVFKAAEYHGLSLKIRKSLFGEDHPEVAHSLINLGNPEYLNGNIDTAILIQKMAIKILNDNYGKSHPNLSQAYRRLADNYQKSNLFYQAEKAHIESLNVLNYSETDSLSNVNSLSQLIGSLFAFARFYERWFHNSNSSIDNLVNSRKYHLLTADALNYQMHTLSPAIKSNFAFQLNKNYSYTMSIDYLLYSITDSIYYLKEGYNFSEKSKAILLFEAMQETNALHVADIPDTLLQQEYDLRIDIAYYDKKCQEKLSSGLSDTDTIVLEIAGKLFELNREYETLKKHFETTYPQYYKAKYDLSTILMETVQSELLQPDQTLLEYLVGDSSIFLFLIQPDTFEVHEIKHDFPLDSLVQQMTKDGIYGYHAAPTSKQTRPWLEKTITNYAGAASQLYEKLIGPVADRLKEKVIIVPDGVLGYLPFEALLAGKPGNMGDFSTYPFMVREHQISYCYSATLLKEMRDKQHHKEPSGGLFAVAPFYLDDVDSLIAYVDSTDILAFAILRDSLGKLDGSGLEVAAINKTWKGTALYGQDASLSEFQKKASDYRILHLSTHGKADDRVGDYAYLAFSMPNQKGAFEKLYARDLYNYSLNADMVVLSACETGIGKLQKGEGIVSLARAFAYAGAKSIFTTLWQVNDEKTKDLMVAFYGHLKEGKEKDEALRLAKLDYLKAKVVEPLGGHPFFWAGMIGIGDMGAVE